ncbi:Uncharacterised protein [Mycolicibacterium fortuitum]|uniref:Uncharacterized protein n=1 Tax=Mycolicibacterium fortuitum TaxID=1766 RepID=A0A378V2B2_MYCFO|nr:Uncharacterised protein [Mycolicibacterium fortuitum]
MKDIAFLLADVWLIVVAFSCGWKFLRHYGNWLLGLECLVVGVSATNFLVGSLLGPKPAASRFPSPSSSTRSPGHSASRSSWCWA